MFFALQVLNEHLHELFFFCFFLPAIYCGNILFVQNFIYFWRIYCWFYRLQDVPIIMNSSSCDIMYYGGTNSCRGLSDKCHRNVPGVDLFLSYIETNRNFSGLSGRVRFSPSSAGKIRDVAIQNSNLSS